MSFGEKVTDEETAISSLRAALSLHAAKHLAIALPPYSLSNLSPSHGIKSKYLAI